MMHFLDFNREYGFYLLNKKVALIAGGEYNQAQVDNYEVHVRVNEHWIKQGGRCDVLYHNCVPHAWKPLAESKSLQPKFVIANSRGTTKDAVKAWCDARKIPLLFYHCFDETPQNAWHRNIARKCLKSGGGMPFTGTAAAEHLSLFPAKEILITGMPLYTGTIKDKRRMADTAAHNPYANAMVLKELITSDYRILPGKELADGIRYWKERHDRE